MKNNLSFSITNYKGEMVTCQILSILPTHDNDFYVLFTDGEYDQDEVPVFKYGKMIENQGSFELKSDVSQEELKLIQNQFASEIQKLVNQYKR